MKLRLLLFAVFISLASCSGDDSSPVDENPNPQPEPVNKVLYQTEYYIYDHPTAPYKQVTTFENDKAFSAVAYEEDGTLMYTIEFTYDQSGNIKREQYFNPAGIPDNFRAYEYDSQGRLTKHTINAVAALNYFETRDYVYNDDNTITVTATVGVNNPTYRVYTHYLNAAGKIYRIKEPWFEEYIYTEAGFSNAGNLGTLTYSDELGVMYVQNFHYSSVIPKGSYIARGNVMGTFNNYILKDNSFLYGPQSLYRTTYDFSSFREGISMPPSEVNYMFDFDADGYPVSEKYYVNGILELETKIMYQETE